MPLKLRRPSLVVSTTPPRWNEACSKPWRGKASSLARPIELFLMTRESLLAMSVILLSR
ncbi:hypothetical protein D3C86_2153360 [compost metagenome]